MMKKLHLGCGSKILKGFVNVDIQDIKGVDYSGVDASDLSRFEDDSFDLIYASHVLEHIPRTKTFFTLLEWNRVLKPGGVLRIGVPDFDSTVKVYLRDNDYENLLNWIYGGSEVKTNIHYRQFTFSGLKTLLIEAGFKRVHRYDWKLTEHKDVDDFTQAYNPHLDSDNGILMSLNIEATKHLNIKNFK
jgi:SAM-dependent methyltransferase